MKKLLSIILALTLLALVTLGCGNAAINHYPAAESEHAPTPEPDAVRLSIVSTIFPQYDWVREILGDAADSMDLTLLINNRVDMHSFQPTVSDIVRISTADLLIYVGGKSDGWVEDAIAMAENPDMIIINLVELLGDAALVEEAIEGMEHLHGCGHDHDCDDDDCDHDHGHGHGHDHDCDDDDCDHDHGHGHDHDCDDDDCDHDHGHDHDCDCDDDDCDHDHDHGHDHDCDSCDCDSCDCDSCDCDHADCDSCSCDSDHDHDHHDHDDCDHADCDHDHFGEIDEHVWLSLNNAIIFTTAIADALSTLDPDNAEMFAANLAAYNQRLIELDAEFRAAVESAANNTLLFGDRFPFRYLVKDYGLNHYAAFQGCHAEAEASFSTIIFLAEKIDELGLRYVIVTESSDGSIAETIINNTQTADQQILIMDSMQMSNDQDRRDGITYISIMESNLLVLKEALS